MNTIEKAVPKEYPYIDEENQLVYFNQYTVINNQVFPIRWTWNNKDYYTSVGYTFTKYQDIIMVDVIKLNKKGGVKINAFCPMCGRSRITNFRAITKSEHSKCRSCTKIKDLKGDVFHKWTVIRKVGTDKNNHACWECKCECGNVCNILGTNLIENASKSCGCDTVIKIGENSPLWKSNLTKEHRDSFRNNKDIFWAKEVKKRDDYICQSCSKRGGNLVSHHLNGHKYFPKQRRVLQNGVTLCKKCHKEFHLDYMKNYKEKCTRSDFISFLQSRYPTAPFLVPSSH